MGDYGLSHSTTDIEWITCLAADASPWIIVTGDHRIRKNLAERTAWIKAGLKAFVLARAYQKTPVHQCASILLWRWPEMEKFMSLAAPGSMFEMSINRKSGFTPLAIE